MSIFEQIILLAQDPGGGPAEMLRGMWIPLLIIGVLFYFMLLRPEQRKRAEMNKMLSNLKKNDRVVTVGGIYGTIVNVQKDSEDVTIKVDETTNAKIRVLRSSISRVLADNLETDKNKS